MKNKDAIMPKQLDIKNRYEKLQCYGPFTLHCFQLKTENLLCVLAVHLCDNGISVA